MNLQEAKYIVDYFPRLLLEEESSALKQRLYRFKLQAYEDADNKPLHKAWKKHFTEKLGYDEHFDVEKAFAEGYDNFIVKVGLRIERDSPDQYVINRCPKCQYIAKTPYARQCRNCKFTWHNSIAGEFLLDGIFRLKNRPYLWIVGDVKKGQVRSGDLIDFTGFQLPFLAVIRKIEYALKSVENIRVDLPTFGIEVSEAEEALIRQYVRKSAKRIMVLKGG
ncbi:MAG: hypothetical protein AAFY48_01750 [Bacteroidota bacterium]